MLVGDGPEKEDLVRRYRGLKNVRFLDPVPRNQMPDILDEADVAIVPLKDRICGAVPSKLYEAMGAGLPIVLVAEGEPEAIVRETQAGEVVRPGDLRGLVDAIRQLAANPDRRAVMGRHGREAAVSRFNRDTIAANFVAHLEQISDHRSEKIAPASERAS